MATSSKDNAKRILSKNTCNVCGAKATYWLTASKHIFKGLKIGFCSEHKGTADEVMSMLLIKGMGIKQW